ncbi:unnamed protein product [Ilex paraguariensis]|uniref:Uncharacterized protein n=1 Tax=Ilex paraguariensis TaxID=185542 RepID=A0ABC8SZ80_9AQUA
MRGRRRTMVTKEDRSEKETNSDKKMDQKFGGSRYSILEKIGDMNGGDHGIVNHNLLRESHSHEYRSPNREGLKDGRDEWRKEIYQDKQKNRKQGEGQRVGTCDIGPVKIGPCQIGSRPNDQKSKRNGHQTGKICSISCH